MIDLSEPPDVDANGYYLQDVFGSDGRVYTHREILQSRESRWQHATTQEDMIKYLLGRLVMVEDNVNQLRQDRDFVKIRVESLICEVARLCSENERLSTILDRRDTERVAVNSDLTFVERAD